MTLEQALKTKYQDKLVQYSELPNVDKVQIVVKMQPEKKLFGLQLLDSYNRKKLIKLCHEVLAICEKHKISMDLRLAIKVPTGITVSDMIFPKDVVNAYNKRDNLEKIASYYHIVSGLR